MIRSERPLHRMLIALGVAALIWTGAAADDALASELSGDVAFALILKDVSSLEDRWGASVFGRAGKDPQIGAFLKPFTRAFKDMIAGGESEDAEAAGDGDGESEPWSFERMLPALAGGAAFVVDDPGLLDDDPDVGSMLFVAGIGNRELLDEVLAENRGFGPLGPEPTKDGDDAENIRIETEEFLGVKLRKAIELDAEGNVVDTVAIALTGDRLLAGGEDPVRAQIERMEKGFDSALGDRAEVRSLSAHAPTADVAIVVALDAVIAAGMAEAEAEEQAARELVEDPENDMTFMGDGPSKADVFKGMGLDALGGLAMAVTLDPQETALDLVFTYKEERGIMRILAAYLPGPVVLPKFIPSSAFEASAANFSMPVAWEGLKEMLGGMQPEMGDMIDMQLAQLKEATGIDLEKNVFGSMGETLFVAQFLPESDTPGEVAELDPENIPQVVGLKVDDPDTFAQGFGMLVALLEQGGPNFRAIEYLDDVFYELTMPGAAPADGGEEGAPPSGDKIGFAHAGGHLMISTGGTEPIRAILAQMSEPGPTLWDQEKVKTALERLPEGASAVSASSTFQLGRVFFSAFAQAVTEAVAEEGGEVESGEMPPAEVFARYFDTAVSGVYRDSGELRMTWRLLSEE